MMWKKEMLLFHPKEPTEGCKHLAYLEDPDIQYTGIRYTRLVYFKSMKFA